MKLAFILLLTGFLHVNASSFAQKININKKNVLLMDVLKEIREQSGYNILFTGGAVKNQVVQSIDLFNASIDEAMNKSLGGLGLTYKIVDKNIVISRIREEDPRQPKAIPVTGKVTDEKGEALAGVAVKVKNAQTGAVTDANGTYKITVNSTESVLVYSFIGFTSQERKVGNDKSINIILKEQSTALNQIVVIGYGEVARKDLTGAVSEVNVKDIVKAPVPSFMEALAGRVAGVSVSANDGQPGSEMNIVIRGANSLTQTNAPLYVIDGFPVEDMSSAAINPDDIEILNILKDASSTAVYGARGANGVVVIETKKGKIGKPIVTFNSSVGVHNVTKQMEMMSSYDFVKYQLELNESRATNRYLSDRTLDDYKNIEGVDWQGKILRTAVVQNHNLAIRGGNPQTKYSVSGSLFKQPGVINNTGFNRTQFRASLDQTISKKISAGFNANFGSLLNYGQLVAAGEGNTSTYLLYRTWGYRPVNGNANFDLENDIVDPENIQTADIRLNPYITSNNDYTRNRIIDLIANAYIKYDIAKGLTLRITGSAKGNNQRRSIFYNSNTTQGSSLNPSNKFGVNGNIRYSDTFNWSNQNTLTWNKTYNKIHKLTAMAGTSIQENQVDQYGYGAINIDREELGMSGLETGDLYSAIALSTGNTLASFYGRINYGFRSKYLLTATFRADGSSKFAKGHQWGYFPSGAFAWNMHEEDLIKNIPAVSNSKLRISYGLTGNNRIADFAYLSSLNMLASASYSFNNQQPIRGIISTNLGDTDLKWESTAQTDIGWDLGLFKDKIQLTVDFYSKTTKDLLLYANFPATTGYLQAYKNVGSVRNRGMEFSLNTSNIRKKDFSWSSNFNISFNDSKVLELANGDKNLFSTVSFFSTYNGNPLYLARVGQPMGQFYGYVFDGVYQLDHFDNPAPGQYVLKKEYPSNASATDRDNIQPGDIRYKDLNGDGVINSNDMTVIGRALPIHTGGFNNNFSYKNFDLNVFFQWSYGNQIFNANRLIFDGNGPKALDLNQFASYSNRWTPENPSNTTYRTGGQGPQGIYSSRVLEDGSFLRLKTVALAYSFPKRIIKSMYLSELKLNIAAQNLITWTKYSGMDPEVSVRNNVPTTPGFDYSAYPMARTIVFGINATF
ncbi:TonB-dependent receptor [Pseudopedobacter beijingensis]|uniref:TonB-dependent receptor n=1 Tax=Pseudopedobacter beijingensis TaxID=1207056 RepID=A0ABW4IG40_9SPHI